MKSMNQVLTVAPRAGDLPRILMICLALAVFLFVVSIVPAENWVEDASSEVSSEAEPPKSTVAGTVVDASGHPVSGATVGIRRSYQKDGSILFHGRLRSPTTTGPEGAFEISGLDCEKLEIMARKDGYQSTSSGDIPVGTTGVELVLKQQGTIGGTVLDQDGSPFAGAEVRMLAYDSTRHGYYQDNVIDTAESDDEGRWSIFRLDPGRYAVYAVDGEDRTDLVQDVDLSSGEDVTGIELRLQRGRVRVSGRVVDKQSREGIADAEVALSHVPSGIGPYFSGRTGGAGEFLFNAVPPGKFRLWISDVEGYTQPDRSVDVGSLVSVSSADVDDITVELERPGTVMGRVFLPSGEPAEGATVSPRGREIHGYYEGAACDQLGIFRVDYLPAGKEFRLIVDLEGYPLTESPPITLGPGEVRDDIEFHFQSGRVISGRVIYEDGEPVSGGYTMRAASSDFSLNYGESPVDASGYYEIRNVLPGSALVMIERDVPDQFSGQEIYSKRKHLTVKRDEDLTGIDFNVSRPRVFPGFIAGRVMDPHGNGVGDLSLLAYAMTQPGEEFDEEQGDRGEAITEADGTFRIDNLREGRFRILVRAGPGSWGIPYVLEREMDDEIEVVSPADEVDIALKRYVSVSGKVVDKDTGEPVTSYEIAVSGYYHQGGSMTTINDPEGEFRFNRVAPFPGNLVVRVKDRSQVWIPLELPEDEDVTGIVVELPGKTGIEGKVLSQRDGSPVEGVQVGTFWGEFLTRTDDEGEFSLAGLAGDFHRLKVDHPDYGLDLSRPIEVPKGAVVSGVVIELATPGRIQGHVYDPGLDPVEGVEVRLGGLPGFWRDSKNPKTDENGFYEFPCLSPHEYRVQLQTRATAANWGPTNWILLRPGETQVVDFGGPGGGVRGTVLRNEGPVADAEVRLIHGKQWTLGSTSLYQMTGEDGTYQFTGLDTGRYQLALLGPFPTAPPAMKEIDVGTDEMQADLVYPTGSISGRVVRADSDQPVAYATVKALRKNLDRRYVGTWTGDYFVGSTDEEGNYQIEWLPSGDYTVQASDPPLAWETREVSLGEAGHAEDIDFSLEEGGGLLIALVDAQSGRPVDGSVRLYSESGLELMRTDARQSHRIKVGGMPPGECRVMACPSVYEACAWGPSFHTVKVESGVTRGYELPCPRACRVKLLLSDPFGEPVTGVDLGILDVAGENRAAPPYSFAFVAPFNLYHLPRGEYTVSVRKDGFEPVDTTLVVPDDTLEMEKTIVLHSSGK